MVEDMWKLSKADCKEIIKDVTGIEVPGGMEGKQVFLMAMSFANIGWYKAENKEIPFRTERAHDVRLQIFIQDVEHVRRFGQTEKEDEKSVQMEIPGTPEPVADPREVLS